MYVPCHIVGSVLLNTSATTQASVKNWISITFEEQEVLERTNLPTFLTLFKNVIYNKTTVCPNITLVCNSVPILKHSHIQNNVSNKRIVVSSWSFTILNFNCVGTTANSCISGSRNFIIFLYFINLRRKLNSLQRYDIAQNYRILHRVVQRLFQDNLKISHHRHI
jgi:hypothetical protein